jgi:ubiquinone/menaquinone biosynthesis C-methylase UbiE
MAKEMYRILKPGAKLVVRELALSDRTQNIFQKFIREKDRLSEFDSLVSNRYFPKKEDTINLLKGV